MATYRGIIFIKGTIGGINFYDRLGKPTLREGGGGFTREAIKNSPRMVRVREMMNFLKLHGPINILSVP